MLFLCCFATVAGGNPDNNLLQLLAELQKIACPVYRLK